MKIPTNLFALARMILTFWIITLISALPIEAAEFPLVEGKNYSGVIIPAEEAAKLRTVLEIEKLEDFWTPGKTDITKTEEAVTKYISNASSDTTINEYRRKSALTIQKNLKEYGCQYIGIIVGGQKYVFCNFFRKSSDHEKYWKRGFIFVLDGGSAYWQIECVLEKNQCINFRVNGEA